MKCNFCNASFKAKELNKVVLHDNNFKACGLCLMTIVSKKGESTPEEEEMPDPWTPEVQKKYDKELKVRKKENLKKLKKVDGIALKEACKHLARSFMKDGIVCKDCGESVGK